MNRPFSLASCQQALFEVYSQTKSVLLPVLITIAVCSYDKIALPRVRNLLFAAAVFFFYFSYFLITNSLIRMEHYFLPVSAMLIILIAFSAQRLAFLIQLRFIKFRSKNTMIWVSLALLALCATMSKRSHSLFFENTIRESRALSRDLLGIISAAQSSRLRVYVDPYVPFRQQLGTITNSDSPTAASIDLRNFDILVLSSWYVERFAADSGTIEWERKRPNWKEIRAFYLQFKGKEEYTDSFNQKWVKAADRYKGRWFIWKKKDIFSWP
jgi:hypothetical protein